MHKNSENTLSLTKCITTKYYMKTLKAETSEVFANKTHQLKIGCSFIYQNSLRIKKTIAANCTEMTTFTPPSCTPIFKKHQRDTILS